MKSIPFAVSLTCVAFEIRAAAGKPPGIGPSVQPQLSQLVQSHESQLAAQSSAQPSATPSMHEVTIACVQAFGAAPVKKVKAKTQTKDRVRGIHISRGRDRRRGASGDEVGPGQGVPGRWRRRDI
jgi:hypothetical protein